ncbi:hypothetical protein evm_000477 [Chilo suppressalis]|nr:hypothetical protein evm_000477 [Chilo suppressalis]
MCPVQLSSKAGKMRTVLVLATVASLALAGTIPPVNDYANVKTVAVDAPTLARQYKVLELLQNLDVVNFYENYPHTKDYDISAHATKYEKPEVVEKFLSMYQKDFLPKYNVFNIFNEKIREQTKALYDVFYYAKDFDTFFNSAVWARAHVNQGMFAYTFTVAIMHRADTMGLIIPALYESMPQYYVNYETMVKMYYGRMRGEPFEEYPEYGIYQEGDHYYYYQNYSDYHTYGEEQKLAYLTEDIGWNAFYSYFHIAMPFWEDGDEIAHGVFKERRGEVYYHFYQQVLARYYLERLSNGMGEIPKFSWYQPLKQGYRPSMTFKYVPFAQRGDNYIMQNENNIDDLHFVRNYEDMFLSFVEQGQFTAFNQQVDFSDEKAINFVGNYWQANPDLYDKISPRRNYYNSYEAVARRIIGGAPPTYNEYDFVPSALDFYQTAMRDPAFYQIYNKIWHFMAQYKKYLPSYSQEDLHYVGVKINKVEVSDLHTFFEYSAFNATSAVYPTTGVVGQQKQYMVVQPRLNHESFKIKFSVKSEVADQASFKIFIGPKYDSYGNEVALEDNWMNFVEMDWFSQTITKGENVIERNSEEFFFYKEDSVPIGEIYKQLGNGKVPSEMVYKYDDLPKRLMLPRGTKSGFPLQVFVVVYKSQGVPKALQNENTFILDERPLGYPFDRPVPEYFMQPNMYIQDVTVYQKGSEYPNYTEIEAHSNDSTKH